MDQKKGFDLALQFLAGLLRQELIRDIFVYSHSQNTHFPFLSLLFDNYKICWPQTILIIRKHNFTYSIRYGNGPESAGSAQDHPDFDGKNPS